MKFNIRKLYLLALSGFTEAGSHARKLTITGSLPVKDFCTYMQPNLTVSPYNPTYTFTWKHESNYNYASNGMVTYPSFATGQRISGWNI